jgi:hypothetical protein
VKVAFLHVEFGSIEAKPKHHDQIESNLLAQLMVESVRRTMPDVPIVQFTDLETPGIPGCQVIRKTWKHHNPMVFRMEHLADMDSPVLCLDTDCIVQADVSSVFGLPFDVALTYRDRPVLDPSSKVDLATVMPFNTGVIFSRSREFWLTCLDRLPKQDLGWYADQLVVARVAPSFNVLKLHTDNFNYSPHELGEDTGKRLIVHYKGIHRKAIFDNPIWEAA